MVQKKMTTKPSSCLYFHLTFLLNLKAHCFTPTALDNNFFSLLFRSFILCFMHPTTVHKFKKIFRS